MQVLKRINAKILSLIAAGHDLPPPPKTAISGPEYFGLCRSEVHQLFGILLSTDWQPIACQLLSCQLSHVRLRS